MEFQGDPQGFAEWVGHFFDLLAPTIAATLKIDPEAAQLYCDTQRDDLLVHGMQVMTTWTPDYLAGLALQSSQQDPMQSVLMEMAKKPAPNVHVEVKPANVEVHPSPVTINQPHPPSEPKQPSVKRISFEKKDGKTVGATIEES